jgi:hypothetical protein
MKKILLTSSLLGITYGAAEPSKSLQPPTRGGSVEISTALVLEKDDQQQHLKQEQRHLTQEEVIENLLQGMSDEDKGWVSYAVAQVDPSKWTDEFVQIVNALSLGMYSYYKSWVIESVAKIDPSNYGRFINTVNALSQGMNAQNKCSIICAVTAEVDPSKWTDEFVQTVNTLSVGPTRIAGDDYTGGLVRSMNACLIIDDAYKGFIIESVAEIDPSNYGRFINTVNTLSQRMDGSTRHWVIYAVSYMSSEWWDSFVDYAGQTNFFEVVPEEDFFHSLYDISED